MAEWTGVLLVSGKLGNWTSLLAKWLRCPPREQQIRGLNPACDGIFFGSSHTSDLKIGNPVAILQTPGVTESVLGPVGPVTVYCDWMRYNVWSATSLSVWQHVPLFEQIRPWYTLACCWDYKQPAKKKQTRSPQRSFLMVAYHPSK